MLRFQTPSSCACLEWWLWNSADDTFFNYRWSPPWKMFLTTVLRTPQWWWQMWYTSTRVSVGSSGTTKASSDRLSFQNMNKYSRTRFSSPTGGFSTWIQRWTPPPPQKKFSFHANVWVLVYNIKATIFSPPRTSGIWSSRTFSRHILEKVRGQFFTEHIWHTTYLPN